MDDFQFLESLNPVPGDRGNPGPIRNASVNQPGPRRHTARASILVAAGVVGIALAGAALFSPRHEPQRLDTVVEVASEPTPGLQDDVSDTRQVEGSAEDNAPDDYAVARLEIPSIELDLIVVDDITVNKLRLGPGHDPSTPLPGQPGNAVVSGRRTTYGAPFHRLDELASGDSVTVTTEQGEFEYRVTGTRIVGSTDVDVVGNLGDNRLTLISNHPKYSRTSRIVVTAELIDRPVEAAPSRSPLQSGRATLSQATRDVGTDEVNLMPLRFVSVRGEYVGLASAGQTVFSPDRNQHVRLVRSDDGLTWELIKDAPEMFASSSVIAHHDGDVHVVGVQLDPLAGGEGDAFGYTISHFASSDLVEWDSWVEPLVLDVPIRGLLAVDAASADFGVLVAVRQVPDFGREYDYVVEQGYTDPLCGTTGTTSKVTFRVCGTADEVTIALPPQDQEPDLLRASILYRGLGEPFRTVDGDELGVERHLASVYSTPGRLGVVANNTVETSDGTNWVPVEPLGTEGAMIAARGTERVFRTTGRSVARPAPNMPMGYAAEGEEWTATELGPLLDDQANTPLVSFGQLQAGPAGWAFVLQRKLQLSNFDNVDRQRTSGPSDFTITSRGLVLEGRTPFGSAVLRDRDGQIIREWDHLEIERPDLAGFEVDLDALTLRDDAGKLIAWFPADAWGIVHQPNETFVFDVLVSTDGRTWSRRDSSVHHPVIAVGEDEVLIAHRSFHPGSDDRVSFTSLIVGPS